MTVLWQLGRRSAGARQGGDHLQMEEGSATLRRRGWTVRSCLRAKEVRPVAGDWLHLFNLQRSLDWGDLPERAIAAGARVVLTPLYHPIERYHREGRSGLARLGAQLVPDGSNFASLRWGLRGRGGRLRMRAAEVLVMAERVLLSHSGEQALLEEAFGVQLRGEACAVVPVAVPSLRQVGVLPEVLAPFGPLQPFALCVGRVEPLKNTLSVVAAAAQANIPLVLAGALPGLRHLGYQRRLERQLRKSSPRRLMHLGSLPYPRVRALMAEARVHVLASWTEVVGRVSLEAALAGTAVVLSDVGFAPDYLGRDTPGVFVVPPGDQGALSDGILRAWSWAEQHEGGPKARALSSRVAEHYTWAQAGPALEEALSA